jgi:hypothetical protein
MISINGVRPRADPPRPGHGQISRINANSQFNLNQQMKKDNTTGKTEHTQVRLKDEIDMELHTEMALSLPLSACPTLASTAIGWM